MAAVPWDMPIGVNMSINALIRVVPPPAKAVETGTPQRWLEIESELGTKLPPDYVELVRRYGSGAFVQEDVDQTWIRNPVPKKSLHWMLEEVKRKHDAGQLEDYVAFPKPGGLLLVGGNDVPITIYYLTEGDPDAWPILAQAETGEFERYETTLTDFLARLFSGRHTPPWKKGWFKKGRTHFQPQEPPADDRKAQPRVNVYQLYVANGNKADFFVTHPGYDPAIYHIKKVAGKSAGALKGSPPGFGNPPVEADGYEMNGEPLGEANMEDFAGFEGFVLVDPPPGMVVKGKKRLR